MSTAAFGADPLQFMADNIILVDWVQNQADTTRTVREFKLEQWAGKTVKKKPNGGVFKLLDANATDQRFTSYWCPYTADNHLGAFLMADAVCMFTAVMDGCSFGIGSATNDGSRAVFHANRIGAGTAAVGVATTKSANQRRLDAQVGAQAEALDALLVPAGNVIDPKKYAGNKGKMIGVTSMGIAGFGMKYKSTTFGLRDAARGWLFYTLRYRKLSASEYEHGKLKTFVPGD